MMPCLSKCHQLPQCLLMLTISTLSAPQDNYFLQYRYHDAEQTFLDWWVTPLQ